MVTRLTFGVLEWIIREFGIHSREEQLAREYLLWPLTLTYWWEEPQLATIDLGSREILRVYAA